MKLNVRKRQASRKSESKQLRRQGLIPAVLYHGGKEGESVAVTKAEFVMILRQIPSGRLSTTVFTLVDEAGKQRRVLIKDIQYEVTSYEVLHLDFEELVDGATVNVKVPIECMGVADCVGVKLGGVVRQVIRYLRINCLPKDLPGYFQLDVRDLQMGQAKRLADLSIPNTVRPLVDLKEVAVVIVKR